MLDGDGCLGLFLSIAGLFLKGSFGAAARRYACRARLLASIDYARRNVNETEKLTACFFTIACND